LEPTFAKLVGQKNWVPDIVIAIIIPVSLLRVVGLFLKKEIFLKRGFLLKTQVEPAIGGAADGAIDGAIDGAASTTKRKLSVLLKAIACNEGKRTPDFKEITKLGSDRTIERYIEQLKEVGFIYFKGSAPQTGGYYVTDKLKKIISKETTD